MLVTEFEMFIAETRVEFRKLISEYLDGMEKEMKKLLKNKLDMCCSDFEVTILKESLQDEFNLYLSKLKGE